MKFLKFMLVAVVAVTVVGCNRVQPIYNVEGQAFPSIVESLDQKEIEQAIVRAGNSRDWIISPNPDGSLDGLLMPRQHVAKIRIEFDQHGFSIQYKDSEELLYSGGKIHRNYNRWVRNLEDAILQEVSLTANTKS